MKVDEPTVMVGAIYKESNFGLPVRVVEKNPRGWGDGFFVVEFLATGGRVKMYKEQLTPWKSALPDGD